MEKIKLQKDFGVKRFQDLNPDVRVDLDRSFPEEEGDVLFIERPPWVTLGNLVIGFVYADDGE